MLYLISLLALTVLAVAEAAAFALLLQLWHHLVFEFSLLGFVCSGVFFLFVWSYWTDLV